MFMGGVVSTIDVSARGGSCALPGIVVILFVFMLSGTYVLCSFTWYPGLLTSKPCY